MKKEQNLLLKKDTLFRQKNPARWGYKGDEKELVGRSDELFKDKVKAFKFMLTDETKQLHEMHEGLCYFSN